MSATPNQQLPKWLRIVLTPYLLLASAVGWVIAMVVGIPITILMNTVLRRRCDHCGRRGLRGTRCIADQTLHPGDSRDFHFSECDYCKHQFHTFDDRSRIHISPDDPRYVTV